MRVFVIAVLLGSLFMLGLALIDSTNQALIDKNKELMKAKQEISDLANDNLLLANFIVKLSNDLKECNGEDEQVQDEQVQDEQVQDEIRFINKR